MSTVSSSGVKELSIGLGLVYRSTRSGDRPVGKYLSLMKLIPVQTYMILKDIKVCFAGEISAHNRQNFNKPVDCVGRHVSGI